jgi:hypothetical protein
MNTRFHLLASWFVLIATPAASPGAGTENAPILPASQCPQVFGDGLSQERNRQLRTRALEKVTPGKHMINLLHTGKWRPPSQIRFQGLVLRTTTSAKPGDSRALVEIGQLPGGLECTPGTYELKVDDSIGGQGHVLAILDNSVLLEHKGELRFWKIANTESPVFRMIWRATWSLAGAEPASSGPVTSAYHPGSTNTAVQPHTTTKSSSHRTSPKVSPRPH